MCTHHFELIYDKLCMLTTNFLCNTSKSVGTPIICNKITC